MIGNLNSVNIVNTGSLTSDSISNVGALTTSTITSSGLVTCNNGLTVTGSILNYGRFAASGAVSCHNGFSVTAGTVSFAANAIALTSVNGLTSRLTKLDNLTGSMTVIATIISNTITINYFLLF